MVPATCTPPLPLTSATWPDVTEMPRAWITPVMLMTLLTRPEAASAVSTTRPPSAWMTPPCATSVSMSRGFCVTGSVTATEISPSP